MDRNDEALADLDQAIRLVPESAKVTGTRRRVHRALSRYEDAVADLTRAVELDPDESLGHENKGIALAAIGDFGRALAELDIAAASGRP